MFVHHLKSLLVQSCCVSSLVVAVAADGRSVPHWLNAPMLTAIVVSTGFLLSPVTSNSMSHIRASLSNSDHHSSSGEDRRRLAALCSSYTGCDSSKPSKVTVCDKRSFGKVLKTRCAKLSSNLSLRLRLITGQAQCGPCPPVCTIGPFKTSQALRAAVDKYLSGTCTTPTIETWDVSRISDFSELFTTSRNPNAATFNADISAWNISSGTTTRSMFEDAISFDQPLAAWDTARLQDTSYMFLNASSFNHNINNWNVTKVSDASYMFADASSFRQDLNLWQTTSLEKMDGMFVSASQFNSDISSWDVSKVRSMYSTFRNAVSFNQNIASWDTSRLTDMLAMFKGATSFDQDVSSWSVTSVTTFESMFENAASMNQDLCGWGTKVQSTTSFLNMFVNSGCPQKGDPVLTAIPPGPFCFSCAVPP